MNKKKILLIILPLVTISIVGAVLAKIFLFPSLPVNNSKQKGTEISVHDDNSTSDNAVIPTATIGNKKSKTTATEKDSENNTQNTTNGTTNRRTSLFTNPASSPSTSVTATESSPVATVPTTPQSSETSVQPATTAPVTSPDEEPQPATDATPVHAESLRAFLDSSDYSWQSLNNRNCQQLITVNSYGTNTADISMYEKDENGIWQSCNLDTDGFVGYYGVSRNSSEGSYETPYGIYPVGEAFYIDDEPITNLDKFQINDDIYWVDDPESIYDNTKVEKKYVEKDWNSAEHMIEYYSAYRYGFVIKFNTDCVKGKGSAIFFHCSETPTAGCVGVSTEMMKAYLGVLDKNKNPYIIMI